MNYATTKSHSQMLLDQPGREKAPRASGGHTSLDMPLFFVFVGGEVLEG